MAIPGPENPWWWDVLENGQASRYARTFDVDWEPPEAHAAQPILLPILGDHYGRVLESGEIRLERDGDTFRVRYCDNVLPVAPPSLDRVLGAAAAVARSPELAFLAESFATLPPSAPPIRPSVRPPAPRQGSPPGSAGPPARRTSRDRRRRSTRPWPTSTPTADALDASCSDAELPARVLAGGGPRPRLSPLLRRDGLVGLRVEDETVFADTHATRARLACRRRTRRPARSTIRTDCATRCSTSRRLRAGTPRGWIVVEKILAPGERLRPEWPVAGTTGYDFLNLVGGLFVDPAGEAPLTALYAELTGEARPFAEVARERQAAGRCARSSARELNRLTALFLDVCERHRRHRDYTRARAARGAARGRRVAARSIGPTSARTAWSAGGHGRARTRPSTRRGRDGRTWTARPVRLPRDILRLRVRGPLETELVMRFQQLTGAVMAKGVEDTAFYRYLRLVSLNEVGGDPGRFGASVDGVPRRQRRGGRATAGRHARDARPTTPSAARTCGCASPLLSEMPEAWAAAVKRWRGCATAPQPRRRGSTTPPNTCSTRRSSGAWPIDRERLQRDIA